MEPERREHWGHVYETASAGSVSWYQAEPRPSLEALARLGAGPGSSLIDVGGGASNLIDALLEHGWSDLTVLDIAEPALDLVRERLGPAASRVTFRAADVADWIPERRWDVWHDRAVFHFLTQPEHRLAYRRAMESALAPGGLLIVATFASDGPERCSGLPVRRYDVEDLAREMGPRVRLVDSWREEHRTPGGNVQLFTWAAFRKSRPAGGETGEG